MSVSITSDGKVEFHIETIINAMSLEDKIKFVESISCYDDVIKYVTDQIVHGMTENGYSGGSSYSYSQYQTGLDLARKEILIASSKLMEKEYKRFDKAVANYESIIEDYRRRDF